MELHEVEGRAFFIPKSDPACSLDFRTCFIFFLEPFLTIFEVQ